MRRVLIGGVIMLMIIGLSVFSLYQLYSIKSIMITQIDSIYTSLNDRDYETVGKKTRELVDNWESNEKNMTSYLRHNILDEVTISVCALNSYLEYKRYAEFKTQLDIIYAKITHLWDSEKPNIRNIL